MSDMELGLSTTSTEVLEHECATLAAQLAAVTCRWLLVIGELDRREAWGGWGCRSMAHWLSWRCSLSSRAAREHVRVAAALGSLPVTVAAFSRGELSYSKVRALTRVATPEGEADLVDLARTATAAQLDRIIAATVAATADPARRDELRRLDTGYDGAAGLGTLRTSMRPDELEIVEAALRQATAVDGGPAGPLPARRVDALVRICESYLAHGDAARSGADRHAVVLHVDIGDDGDITDAETESGRPVPAETARRIACDATLYTIVHGRLEPVGAGRTTRTPPRRLRRAVHRRSAGRCEWIGCADRTYIELHHVQHWTKHGPTEAWNLTALCWHHHHLVHERGFSVELDRATGEIRCYRPDGSRITPPTPIAVNDTVDCDLDPRHARDAIVPLWAGEHLDLNACVDAVLAITGRT